VAKREASAVLSGSESEFSPKEVDCALRHMRARWQHSYGLVEVG